jgi:hypothetical protein
MATQRTIRRVNSHYQHDFDEQLWPINVALLVLAGFISGLIHTYSDFTWVPEQWYLNGWVRLASLVITVGGFVALSVWLGGQRGRRVQFAAVISLIMHAFIGWQLALFSLSNETPQSTAKADPTQAVFELNFSPDTTNDNQQTQDFEKPIETRPETQQPVVQERTVQQPQPTKVQPLPEPDKVQPQVTNTPQTSVPKIEQAVPRRESTESKLSKSTETAQAIVTPTKSVASSTPKVTTPQQQLTAQSTPRERAAQTPQVTNQATTESTTNTANPTQVAMATPRPSPTETTTSRPAQLARATNTPQATPTAVAEATNPAPTNSANTPSLTANTSNTTKSNSGPQTSQPTINRDVAQSSVTSPAPATSRATPRPDSTSLARADATTPARQSTSLNTQISSSQAENVSTPATNANSATSGLTAQANSTQRNETPSLNNTTVALNTPADNGGSNNPTPAATAIAKANTTPSTTNTANPAVAPAGLSSRPAAQSQAQAIADSIELPTIAATGGSGSPGLTGPSASASNRSSNAPGKSQSPNLNPDWADGPTNPTLAGTASASKATTTESGDGNAPSRDVLARSNSTTPGNLNASTTQAQDVATPTDSGTASQGQLNASASPSQRANSQAAIGNVATAVGNSSADAGSGTGSPTTVASVANNRDIGAGVAGTATAKNIGRSTPSGSGATDTTANDVTAPGLPGANTPANDPQLAASNGGTGRQANGTPGPTINAPLSASSGEAQSGNPGPTLTASAGPSASRVDTLGNSSGPIAPSGGTLARTPGNVTGTGEANIDSPSLPSVGVNGSPNVDPTLQAGTITGSSGASRQAVNVQVAVSSDTGGFGDQYSERVGTLLPQARADSPVLSISPARFLNRTASGATAIDGQIREPAPAYRKRGRISNLEREIELGLEFIAKSQDADGSWSLQRFPAASAADIGQMQSTTAATGLSLLAFLGAGNDHFGEGEKYQAQVQAGLEYLIKNQKPDGDLYVKQYLGQGASRVEDQYSNNSVRLYSHGIATIALCEAFGMTKDDKLKGPAQKAIEFIEKSQEPRLGGWRYEPGKDSDTSVTGWQLMALKSAELAGLNVKPESYDGIRRWLDSAQRRNNDGTIDAAQYAYNPNAADIPTQRHGRLPTPATNSMGLLMRMYLGWDRDHPSLRQGADQLLNNLPEITSQKRDTYYWYYASQVMFHMQGDAWERWNSRLRPILLNSQVKSGPQSGSWDPVNPVPDRWGKLGGRLYVTTLNVLSLEVTHRYLPIYEKINKTEEKK